MDQELMTMINNMKSIAEQMTQMLSGDAGAGAPQEPAEAGAPQGEDENSFMKKLLKVLKEEDENKESPTEDEFATGEKPMLQKSRRVAKDEMDDEATNASDDAEERLDEGIPEASEENIEEVAKSIMKMLRKSKNKSVQKSNTEMPILILADEVKELKKSLSNILEGLGLADAVRNQYVAKAEPRQIRSDNSIQKSLDEIRSLVTGDRVGVAKDSGGFDLHKSLTDDGGSALKAMLSTNSRR